MNELKYDSYRLKYILHNLLADELSDCTRHIRASFEASASPQMFTLRVKEKIIEIVINLNGIKQEIVSPVFSRFLNLAYTAYFIIGYVRLLEASTVATVPKSYFDGLVQMNFRRDMTEGKKVYVCSPLREDLRKRKGYVIRPSAVRSAIIALNRIRIELAEKLSQEQLKAAEEAVTELMIYSTLPEVSYVGRGRVCHSLFAELKGPDLSGLIGTASDSQLTTVKELIHSAIRSNNTFILGVALRIICFSSAVELPEDEEARSILLDAIDQYRHEAILYFKDISGRNSRLLKENLRQIKKTLIKVDELSAEYGQGVGVYYPVCT